MNLPLPKAVLPAVLSLSCAGTPVPPPPSSPRPTVVTEPQPTPEMLQANSPRATAGGATFSGPAGWGLLVDGARAVLTAPEGNFSLTIVDSSAKSADEAVNAAWAAVRPGFATPLRVATPFPGRGGWDEKREYVYETSPDEKKVIEARAFRKGEVWTVVLIFGDQGTFEKRLSDVMLLRDTLRPKGYVAESFAGKTAHVLDEARLRLLTDFLDNAREISGSPGISLALMQGGKTVFAGGFGVRRLGEPAKVDADTLFLIASNTKALTTLLLAELVDDGKLAWDTPVKQIYPAFKLGDPETTGKVQVKHLVCACTGLPRQDYEWLFEFKDATPKSLMGVLGTMQPTTRFGETFQYSNLLAAAAGFVGGNVIYPSKELGAAYDEAMQTRVFGPLGMTSTTFDFARALAKPHASPHVDDFDGKVAVAMMDLNYSMVADRPAGGAWSSARDLSRYVAMELARGVLPNGKRLVSEKNLLARRERQVAMGDNALYGMGLIVSTIAGVTMVHHGGGADGYRSDMFWLPDHGIGGVILTSSDYGDEITKAFERRLLEVLFDGRPEAQDDLTSAAGARRAEETQERARRTLPPDPAVVAKLAARYRNAALGEITVRTAKGKTVVDVGEWRSAIATRKNDDGSVSLMAIDPGADGWEWVVSDREGKRALILRDMQHEYVFVEAQ